MCVLANTLESKNHSVWYVDTANNEDKMTPSGKPQKLTLRSAGGVADCHCCPIIHVASLFLPTNAIVEKSVLNTTLASPGTFLDKPNLDFLFGSYC